MPVATSNLCLFERGAGRVFHQPAPGAPLAHHNAPLFLASVHKQKLGRKILLVKRHHPGCFHVHRHDKTSFRIRENDAALPAGPHALPQFGQIPYVTRIADDQCALYRRTGIIHHHAAQSHSMRNRMPQGSREQFLRNVKPTVGR